MAKMDKEKKKQGFAAGFYHSAAWAKCREAYANQAGGLCERCAAAGKIVPGVQVHHKVRLTPANVYNPEVSLNFKNLELLCEECHQAEHKKGTRWRADEDGHVSL